jgi:hypothetical protein
LSKMVATHSSRLNMEAVGFSETSSHRRRQWSSCSPPWDPHISCRLFMYSSSSRKLFTAMITHSGKMKWLIPSFNIRLKMYFAGQSTVAYNRP